MLAAKAIRDKAWGEDSLRALLPTSRMSAGSGIPVVAAFHRLRLVLA